MIFFTFLLLENRKQLATSKLNALLLDMNLLLNQPLKKKKLRVGSCTT